jgi:gluconokinase
MAVYGCEAAGAEADVMIVVVMGVSGSGKSTIGAGVASALGWPFEDGDDLHPAANVAKMSAGHPLTDADRAGWLVTVRAFMTAWVDAGSDGVLACSALRRSYRDALRNGPGDVRFVFLDVDHGVLTSRLAHRHGHFMPAVLLTSQLLTLEVPDASENVITIPVRTEVAQTTIIGEVLAALPHG